MTEQEVEKLVIRLVSESLGEKGVTPNTQFSDLRIDSLGKVELVMAVEEEFMIEIPDDIAEDVFDGTVRDLIRVVVLKLLGNGQVELGHKKDEAIEHLFDGCLVMLDRDLSDMYIYWETMNLFFNESECFSLKCEEEVARITHIYASDLSESRGVTHPLRCLSDTTELIWMRVDPPVEQFEDLSDTEKDAARYRWLRGKVGVDNHGPYLPSGFFRSEAKERMAVETDDKIDAHIMKGE